MIVNLNTIYYKHTMIFTKLQKLVNFMIEVLVRPTAMCYGCFNDETEFRPIREDYIFHHPLY